MDKKSARHLLSDAQTLCIKIGSSLLMGQGGKPLREDWLAALARDVAALLGKGKQVVLISSGAVAAARNRQMSDSDTLVRKQALAAVGQLRLMMAYAHAFDQQNIEVAQVLMNPADTEDRQRHLNVRGTLEELLSCGVVPIINENDTVSGEVFLHFGDNDRLSARVAGMINADLLVMLSDIDGLYTERPRDDGRSAHVPWLDHVSSEVMGYAGDTGSSHGTGGMRTKLVAAQMCLASNCHMIISSGHQNHPVERLWDGARCTVFQAQGSPIQARKRWLSGFLHPAGQVVIDQGAAEAVRQGKSLLAAGVISLSGEFNRSDAVAILDLQLQVLGHGLINYSSQELDLIKGRKSAEIAQILGLVREKTLIHRDNFTLREV